MSKAKYTKKLMVTPDFSSLRINTRDENGRVRRIDQKTRNAIIALIQAAYEQEMRRIGKRIELARIEAKT